MVFGPSFTLAVGVDRVARRVARAMHTQRFQRGDAGLTSSAGHAAAY
jgi:hypothetical protein